jgi:hypothetical protein
VKRAASFSVYYPTCRAKVVHNLTDLLYMLGYSVVLWQEEESFDKQKSFQNLGKQGGEVNIINNFNFP